MNNLVLAKGYVAVATALTVYGIETLHFRAFTFLQCLVLQQHLPFTVLKLVSAETMWAGTCRLQQHLPFTVLKLITSAVKRL